MHSATLGNKTDGRKTNLSRRDSDLKDEIPKSVATFELPDDEDDEDN